MSYNLRNQRVAYSNVVVGTAATRENLMVGTDIPTELPSVSNIKRADGQTSVMDSSTEPTTDARNRIITSSGGVTTLEPREYPAV